jgi:hypothetical protein
MLTRPLGRVGVDGLIVHTFTKWYVYTCVACILCRYRFLVIMYIQKQERSSDCHPLKFEGMIQLRERINGKKLPLAHMLK